MARFYTGYPWRFIVTNLQLETMSWMQGLVQNRRVVLNANQPSEIDFDVFPDDFRVNGLVFDTGSTTHEYPRVAQSNRIVWAYRRESNGGVMGDPAWVCRGAGIIMAPDDQGDADVPLSHMTAYDPFKLLEARPAMDITGQLPDPQLGFENPGAGSDTALQYLLNTITNEGGVFIDAGPTWGGTIYYGEAGGVLETTPDVVITVQLGQTVAEVWQELIDAGNLDIELIPVYDPRRSIVVGGTTYYFTHELSIKNVAGSQKPDALMGYDRLNRAINRIDRAHDATPGAFFDVVQYYAGLAPVPTTPLRNIAAEAAFGNYWSQQFYPSLLSQDDVQSLTFSLATLALELAKQGRRTLSVDLTAGRGPIPLIDFGIHDYVPVHASDSIRVTVDGYLKVTSIPFVIDDNGVEKVTGMILNPDYRTQAYP